MEKTKIIKFYDGEREKIWVYDERRGCYDLLNDSFLQKAIPEFKQFNEQARVKKARAFMKNAKVIRKAHLSWALNNAECSYSVEDSKIGTFAILELCNLFEQGKAGCVILSDILCGLRCQALREVEPGFRPALHIPTYDTKLIEIFKTTISAVVTKNKWSGKNCTIKRAAVLDYRTSDLLVGHHIQDFSQIKIRVKKGQHIITPAFYDDTLVLILGASKSQIKEAIPYLENSAIILLNSDPGDLAPEKLALSSFSSYNPQVLALFNEHQAEIAAVLHSWWAAQNEELWARDIIASAKATFGNPDSKYVSVTLNPQKLRSAIQHEVLQSFFAEVERKGWISTEALSLYRQSAKAVFDPEPIVEKPVRRAEDPGVFLEVMKRLVFECSDKILLETDRFVKGNNKLGAYRTISGERYLVLLENAFKRTYEKFARKAGDIDISFLKQDNWEQELQKLFGKSGIIKVTNSNHRYRFDLFQNGTKDKTYVVAIPCDLLT